MTSSMQAPGISVRDLWDLLRKSKDVYDAFQHTHRNAPRRAAAFRDDVVEARESLREITQYGEQYPNEEAFKSVIEECEDYCKTKMPALLKHHDEGQKSTSSRTQTVLLALDDKTLGLYQKLMFKQQQFLNWQFGLLLKNLSNRAEQPGSAPGPVGSTVGVTASSQDNRRSPRTNQGSSNELQDASSELVRLIYSYSRLKNSAAVREASSEDSPADTDSNDDEVERLNSRLWTTVEWICRLTDLPKDYRPLHISLDGLSGRVTDNRRRVVMESFSDAVRYPSPTLMPFPRHAAIKIQFPWGPKNSIRTLEPTSYMVINRRCIFHDDDRRPIFEHRCRSNYHPTTHHKVFEKDSIVCFHSDQHVSTFDTKGVVPVSFGPLPKLPEKQFVTRPEYIIDSPEDRKLFLEDLKGMELMHESDVSKIFFGKEDMVSHSIVLQLWKEHGGSRQSLISFPAGKSWKRVEGPVNAFTSLERKSSSIQLRGKRRRSVNSSSNSSEHSNGSARKFNLSNLLERHGGMTLEFEDADQATVFIERFQEAVTDSNSSIQQNGYNVSPSTMVSSPTSSRATSSTQSTPSRSSNRRGTNGSISTIGTSPLVPLSGRFSRDSPQLPPPAFSFEPCQVESPLQLGPSALDAQGEEPTRSHSHLELRETSTSNTALSPTAQAPTNILSTYQNLRSGS